MMPDLSNLNIEKKNHQLRQQHNDLEKLMKLKNDSKLDLGSLTKLLSMNSAQEEEKKDNLRKSIERENITDNEDLLKELMKKVPAPKYEKVQVVKENNKKLEKPFTMSISEIEKQISLLKNLSLKDSN